MLANAGIMLAEAQCKAWEIPASAFAQTMDVNVGGVSNLCRHFVPLMLDGGRGAFIAMSSGSGRCTGAYKGAYGTSKFAVEAFVKCLAHGLPPPLMAVPLAPGTVATGSGPNPSRLPDAWEWAETAVPYILDVVSQPHLNGASLSVPGFYPDEFVRNWIIADGLELVPEPGTPRRQPSCESRDAPVDAPTE